MSIFHSSIGFGVYGDEGTPIAGSITGNITTPITTIVWPTNENCKAKGLCFDPGNPIKTNAYTPPKCKPCSVATAATNILLSTESCKAKGLCFQDQIIPLRGPVTPRKCIPCASHLFDWKCQNARIRSQICSYNSWAPDGLEKLYCPGLRDEAEASAAYVKEGDEIACRCCRKRTPTPSLPVMQQIASQPAFQGGGIWQGHHFMSPPCKPIKEPLATQICGPRPPRSPQSSRSAAMSCCPLSSPPTKKILGITPKHFVIGVVCVGIFLALATR
jgi:hypothetical protein